GLPEYLLGSMACKGPECGGIRACPLAVAECDWVLLFGLLFTAFFNGFISNGPRADDRTHAAIISGRFGSAKGFVSICFLIVNNAFPAHFVDGFPANIAGDDGLADEF